MLKLNSIQTSPLIDPFEGNIQAFICEIPTEILKRVRQNWTKRMDYLVDHKLQTLNNMDRTHFL